MTPLKGPEHPFPGAVDAAACVRGALLDVGLCPEYEDFLKHHA